MSVLIVGGDSLGVIEDNLRDMGFDSIYHVDRRKKSPPAFYTRWYRSDINFDRLHTP